MGLESATLISDLVATNPLASDPKSQGDDHIRMLKSVLQTEFPTTTQSLSAGWTASAPVTGVSGTLVFSFLRKGFVHVKGTLTFGINGCNQGDIADINPSGAVNAAFRPAADSIIPVFGPVIGYLIVKSDGKLQWKAATVPATNVATGSIGGSLAVDHFYKL